jgi:hypothetical protein
MPYVNNNPEYRPSSLILSDTSPKERSPSRKYAVAAVMSGKINGNGDIRTAFLEQAESGQLFGTRSSLLLEVGLRVKIICLNVQRRIADEQGTLYRESIFCPPVLGATRHPQNASLMRL